MVAPNELPDDVATSAPDVRPTNGRPPRQGVGIWAVLLVLVIVFGYLTTERRAAIGRLAEQIADIVRDFRGYDPEF